MRHQRGHTVDMVVGLGEDRRPARGTDRIRAEARIEAHAAVGEPIEVWRRVDLRAVGRDRMSGMVIAHDEDDVGDAEDVIGNDWAN